MRQRLRKWFIQLLANLVKDVLVELYPPQPPSEIDDVLKAAYTECGLPADSYHPDFNLLHSGKLHEVLIHAARKMGNPLVTVADVATLLR